MSERRTASEWRKSWVGILTGAPIASQDTQYVTSLREMVREMLADLDRTLISLEENVKAATFAAEHNENWQKRAESAESELAELKAWRDGKKGVEEFYAERNAKEEALKELAALRLRLEALAKLALEWMESARQARHQIFGPRDGVDYDEGKKEIAALRSPPAPVSKRKTCKRCNGTGDLGYGTPDYIQCPECHDDMPPESPAPQAGESEERSSK